MKEIDIEMLDNMFPNGYIIVYTCPDRQIRMSLYNPHRDETINRLHGTLKEKN
jgi:hypothetical protein